MSRYVKGIDEALANINERISAVEGASVDGLLAAGLKRQAGAQRRVPVEYGNLRASAYTQRSQQDPNAVEVGFTAEYAPYVHENLEMKLKGKPRPSGLGVYWGPNGQSRFLANEITENEDDIVQTVADFARKGLHR